MHCILRSIGAAAAAALVLSGCGDGANGGAGRGASTGCSDGSLQSGDQMVSIEHDGLSRVYQVHVPAGYDGSEPWPLVLNFHGLTSDETQQMIFSEMNETADAEGFVVVYPRGVSSSWNGGTCCGTAATEDIDDVGFARTIVEDMGTRGCIDLDRVYATGMSNGGFMSHRLACEASDVFAAFGPVAGVLGIPPEECTPERAVPIIHFHGTEDPLVDYEGGGFVNDLGAPGTMEFWAETNGCDPEPEETFRNGDAHCDTWSGCREGVEVTLCTVDGMGHCWPGSETATSLCETLSFGSGSMDIVANQQMWSLFERSPFP